MTANYDTFIRKLKISDILAILGEKIFKVFGGITENWLQNKIITGETYMGKIPKERIIEELSLYRDQGVIILGPDGTKKHKLRVYAHGGDLGRIGIADTAQCEIHKKQDYLKYLKDEDAKALLELIEESEGKKDNARDESEILCDKRYISLMLKATKQRGVKKEGNKEVRTERVIETSLIAQQGKIENKNNNLLVYDMEYMITLPTRTTIKESGEEVAKHCKPDLIVFDGKNIGIVELKYDADSMENDEKKQIKGNSLKDHYQDFMDFIWNETDKKRWDVIGESICRLKYLEDAGLIDPSWHDNIAELREWHKSNKAGEFDTSRIWIGFYFVEGPHKEKDHLPCEEYVEDQVRGQLKDVVTDAREKGHNTQVRYGYWSNDEKIKLILDKEIKIGKNGQISIQ